MSLSRVLVDSQRLSQTFALGLRLHQHRLRRRLTFSGKIHAFPSPIFLRLVSNPSCNAPTSEAFSCPAPLTHENANLSSM